MENSGTARQYGNMLNNMNLKPQKGPKKTPKVGGKNKNSPWMSMKKSSGQSGKGC